MNLTIIIPFINNKEVIRKIRKEKLSGDKIVPLRVTSKNIKEVLHDNIEKSTNDNVLLINPKDNTISSKFFLNKFRNDGIVVNNKTNNGRLAHSSSIKFSKNNAVVYHDDSEILNVRDFINHIYKANSPHNWGSAKINPVNEAPSQPKTYNKHKPKILFICDVKGWAWWLKSQYLKRYLSDEFNIDIIHLIGKNKGVIDVKKYDLYLTFGYSYVDSLKGVPKHKKISGVTAHRADNKLKVPLSKVDYIHTNSILLNQQINKLFRGKKIYYTPNGVDVDMFHKKSEYDLLDRECINIGHVGKLSPEKGQKEVIEPVIEKLKSRGNKINYIPHYNTYMDKIPHNKMVGIYQHFDLLIIASKEDGTPSSLLEGAACGVPMIGNGVGNVPQFIQNGYNGYIVSDRTNIDEYVRLIEGLDKEHLIEMGKNARQTAENGWTWKIQAENYRRMFRDILTWR